MVQSSFESVFKLEIQDETSPRVMAKLGSSLAGVGRTVSVKIINKMCSTYECEQDKWEEPRELESNKQEQIAKSESVYF